MRFLIQRVSGARVDADGRTVGRIGRGFLVLIGVTHDDTEETAAKMTRKMLNLRIFPDENGKTNLSLSDAGGEILMVSQFTLYADLRKGNRPSFTRAADPVKANALYEYCVELAREAGYHVETGVFGADMKVELLNDGPFTVVLDSATDI